MTLIFTILFAILPACAQEDSTNCAWDAGHSGNGVGHDFVALHKKGSPYDIVIYRGGKVQRYHH